MGTVAKRLGAMALATAALSAAPALADAGKGPPPAAVAAVGRCRAITDAGDRLACFDKAAAELDGALAARTLYVVEKAEVKRTRRSLFGLSLRGLGLFGGDDKDGNEVTQVELVARSASQDVDGNWRVVMEDGSVWAQTDQFALGRPPRAGSKVLIKQAAFGSFKMSIDGHPAVRAKRVL